MFNNPEFKRNLWLELTTHRLIVAPALLALLFMSVGNVGYGIGSSLMATIIFFVVTMLWGAHLAFDSVAEEVRDRTWDNQRMSALSPAHMLVGKLFGATAFTWYIGLPCLIVLAMSFNSKIANEVGIFTLIILLFLGAVFAQALGLLTALVGAKNNLKMPKSMGMIFLLIGLTAMSSLLFKFNQSHDRVWYEQPYSQPHFQIASLLIFTLWLLLACYRTMQTALQVKLKPWAMLVFILFCTFYLLGFEEITRQFSDESYLYHFASIASVLAIGAAYVGVLTEKRDLVSTHRFIDAWRAAISNGVVKGNAALKETPFFIVVLLFAFIVILISMLIHGSEFSIGQQVKLVISWQFFDLIGMIAFVLLLRDIGLLYYFSLSTKPERAIMTTFFYLIALNWLLPMFFQNTLGVLFNPLLYNKAGYSFYVAMVIALMHLVIVMRVFYQRHKSMLIKNE